VVTDLRCYKRQRHSSKRSRLCAHVAIPKGRDLPSSKSSKSVARAWVDLRSALKIKFSNMLCGCNRSREDDPGLLGDVRCKE